jgi:hypothetical protein
MLVRVLERCQRAPWPGRCGGRERCADVPIKPKLRNKGLRVSMETLLDEIAGATYETVQRGSASPWESKPRDKYATCCLDCELSIARARVAHGSE